MDCLMEKKTVSYLAEMKAAKKEPMMVTRMAVSSVEKTAEMMGE